MFNFKRDYIKTILIVLALVLFAIGGFQQFVLSGTKAPVYYTQGTEFLNAKDYQNAYFNYSKIKPASEYYPIALYRQGYCADQLNDTKTSMEKYSQFVNKYPDTIFTPKAMYELARGYYNSGDAVKSEPIFLNLIQNYPKSDFAIASNYYIGMIKKQAAKKDSAHLVYSQPDTMFDRELTMADNYDRNIIAEATRYWLAYLDKCPNCRFSLSSIDEIASTNKAISPEVYSRIGVAFYYNNNFEKAAEYLEKGVSAKYWNYEYMTAVRLRQNDSAKKIFQENFIKYARSIGPDKLNEAINTYVQSFSDKKTAWLDVLTRIRQYHLPSEDFVLYNLALISPEREQMSYYDTIAVQYPKSDYAPESLWALFRYYYKNGMYHKAAIIGEKHISSYSNKTSSPAIIYWMGKLYHSQKMNEQAKYYFQKVMTDYPDDYYAFRAASMFKIRSINSNKSSDKTDIIPFPFEHTGWDEKNTALVKLALDANDLSIIDDLQTDNKIIQSWIFYKNGKISTAAVNARNWLRDSFPRPSFGQSVYKLAFPRLYTDALAQSVAPLKLDPYLILAIIKEESYFNADAQSSSGAMGLMQIMPDTGKYIAGMRAIGYTSKEDLLNPEYNINLGCNYFGYLKDKLHNSNLLAVTAYNGGPGSVSFWLKAKKYADFDDFVEDIPYDETRNYVKKVYRTYWNYLNIY